MRIGKLGHPLTYREPTKTADDFGQKTRTWADVGSLWGDVRTLNGREALAAQAMKATATHVITIRAQGYPVRVTGRLVDAAPQSGSPAGLYDITAVVDEEGRNRALKVYAVEVLTPDDTADESNL